MAKDIQLASNLLPSTGSIEAYIASINALPMLTQEEEYELASRYQREGDLMAAQKLIFSHLRFVASIARGYKGYGLAFADLMQEGTVGLMKAVKRFDPNMGVRLVSFAVHWVKSEMHEYIIKNWRIVKVATTKAQRKLFFNLRRSKQRLGWFTDAEVQSVAQELGVKPKEVMEMEKRLNAHDAAFDMTDQDDDDGHTYHYAPQQYLEAPEADPYQALADENSQQDHTEKLKVALEILDDRSKAIVEKRWLASKKTTLKALAQEYDVSIERVRQIEQAALEKLKDACA